MREIARDYAGLAVTEMARTVCELLEWKRAERATERPGMPPAAGTSARSGMAEATAGAQLGAARATADPAHRSQCAASHEWKEARESSSRWSMRVVESREESRLWTELIERHHYLRYRVPVGANLRYLVRSGQRGGSVLACLLWSSPAWKMAARDEWIGWNAEQRARNLQLIVNNSRFLVLPWVRIQGLASKILAQSARQLPIDWEHRYGYRPLLLETLVDAQRFRGTCYRAANWIHVGQTAGRGRMDREHRS